MKNPSSFFPELTNLDDYLDRDTFVAAMEIKVQDLLKHQPELLFSYLYRLDVLEHKIQFALHGCENVANALAQLIIDRQVERIQTKQQYRSEENKWNWEY